jgi:hypothetical protein
MRHAKLAESTNPTNPTIGTRRTRPGAALEHRNEALRALTKEPTPIVTSTDTNYLDLDGDGLLDAVEIVETFATVDAPSGKSRVLQVVRTVAAGIGDDGAPGRVLSTSSPA